jgi:hypothetical protein
VYWALRPVALSRSDLRAAAQLHEAREAIKARQSERDVLQAALEASERDRAAAADDHALTVAEWEREARRQQQRGTELEAALESARQREAAQKEAADVLALVRPVLPLLRALVSSDPHAMRCIATIGIQTVWESVCLRALKVVVQHAYVHGVVSHLDMVIGES